MTDTGARDLIGIVARRAETVNWNDTRGPPGTDLDPIKSHLTRQGASALMVVEERRDRVDAAASTESQLPLAWKGGSQHRTRDETLEAMLRRQRAATTVRERTSEKVAVVEISTGPPAGCSSYNLVLARTDFRLTMEVRAKGNIPRTELQLDKGSYSGFCKITTDPACATDIASLNVLDSWGATLTVVWVVHIGLTRKTLKIASPMLSRAKVEFGAGRHSEEGDGMSLGHRPLVVSSDMTVRTEAHCKIIIWEQESRSRYLHGYAMRPSSSRASDSGAVGVVKPFSATASSEPSNFWQDRCAHSFEEAPGKDGAM
ncbi:hypothetical protein BJ322DRAFT_1018036 [Thelephora terrestris]|uniref:Uncharacterized protein n=1 Tax=Thelephora terrestris TaxID=56493 RepID=A0A9P6HKL9_9AGAM|nr:hypothetical protein BJ322DRAFT_1018036 [Thelephora terrestris]